MGGYVTHTSPPTLVDQETRRKRSPTPAPGLLQRARRAVTETRRALKNPDLTGPERTELEQDLRWAQGVIERGIPTWDELERPTNEYLSRSYRKGEPRP